MIFMKMQNLFLILSIGLFVSCNQQAQTQSQNQAKNISNQRHQTHAVTKPHAPISMDYEIINPVELNKLLDIKLTFSSRRNVDALTVEYNVDAGLSVNGEPQRFNFRSLPQNEPISIVLKVTPEQAGDLNINVYADIEINGVIQSRAFIVPVSVAQSASSIQSKSVNDKTQGNTSNKGMQYSPQQNVISMPASESSD